jgi:putative DNA primase/helicase
MLAEVIDLGWLGSSPCKRDAVTMYARLGLHPILIHGVTEAGTCTCGRTSCAAIGKHPVNKGWQSAPLDLDALDDALNDLTGNWRYNVGLRMGQQPSGVVLVCVDVDGPRSLLEPLEAEEGMPFPPTLTAKTSRGFHLIYRWPEGREPPTNRAGLAPHVDVRAVGGQIVAPPSQHVSGDRYKWIDTREPAVLP